MKEFTEEELAQCNGRNGNPAYIAYKGKVYDVSASFLWKAHANLYLTLSLARTRTTYPLDFASKAMQSRRRS